MVRTPPSAAGDGKADHVDQVADVDEVPPGVHHEHRLVVGQAVVEGGQRAAEVAWAVRVGETKRDVVERAEKDVLLPRRLADRVARSPRDEGMAEGDRLLDRVQTVAEGGLQVDEAADLQALRRPNDVDRPDHVGHGVAVPVVRVLVRRRRVNNHLRPVLIEGAIDHLGVGDGAFDQCQAAVRREVVAPRCLEVVDDRDDVAVADQPIGEVGPDKTGSACDENPHSLTSSTGLFNRCRNSCARSWKARCHSSRLSRPQICRPN